MREDGDGSPVIGKRQGDSRGHGRRQEQNRIPAGLHSAGQGGAVNFARIVLRHGDPLRGQVFFRQAVGVHIQLNLPDSHLHRQEDGSHQVGRGHADRERVVPGRNEVVWRRPIQVQGASIQPQSPGRGLLLGDSLALGFGENQGERQPLVPGAVSGRQRQRQIDGGAPMGVARAEIIRLQIPLPRVGNRIEHRAQRHLGRRACPVGAIHIHRHRRRHSRRAKRAGGRNVKGGVRVVKLVSRVGRHLRIRLHLVAGGNGKGVNPSGIALRDINLARVALVGGQNIVQVNRRRRRAHINFKFQGDGANHPGGRPFGVDGLESLLGRDSADAAVLVHDEFVARSCVGECRL